MYEHRGSGDYQCFVALLVSVLLTHLVVGDPYHLGCVLCLRSQVWGPDLGSRDVQSRDPNPGFGPISSLLQVTARDLTIRSEVWTSGSGVKWVKMGHFGPIRRPGFRPKSLIFTLFRWIRGPKIRGFGVPIWPNRSI